MKNVFYMENVMRDVGVPYSFIELVTDPDRIHDYILTVSNNYGREFVELGVYEKDVHALYLKLKEHFGDE